MEENKPKFIQYLNGTPIYAMPTPSEVMAVQSVTFKIPDDHIYIMHPGRVKICLNKKDRHPVTFEKLDEE